MTGPDDLLSRIDPGIREAVRVLREAGIATFESCEGGEGHAFDMPTVRFRGNQAEGLAAVVAAQRAMLPVYELRRAWSLLDGEMEGPWWDLVLRPTKNQV